MTSPTLRPGQRYDYGIIIESHRLAEAIVPPSIDRVSDWRLDSDYFVFRHADGKTTAIVIAQGASIAADAVERLVGAGVKSAVRIGTCGGLQTSLRIGDLVVSTGAVKDDGTSTRYLPRGFPATPSMALCSDIQSRAPAMRFGLTWTTDGRWLESDEMVLEMTGLGVLAVDMETAGVYAAGRVRGLPVVSVSSVADLPVNDIGSAFKGLAEARGSWDAVVAATREFLLSVLTKPVEA